MEFWVLGPLEVGSDGRTVGIPAAKERGLLAILLADPNRAVSSDRLIDELWKGSPPESATTSLRVLVSRLRKTLAEFDDRELIVTRSPGYLLSIEPGEVDAARFEAMAARGRSQLAAGDPEGASRMLREALALWRGAAFADIADLEPVRLAATRLEEVRLGVLEDRVEADLAAGRHAQLVSELEALTSEHSVRERLWRQRILALYRCGRQADALAVYQELRRVLDEELGIEPSPELVALETAIIRQDDSLAPRRPTAPTAEMPTGVVTLLLTDIEGSTPLWEAKPAAMAEALSRHDELMGAVVAGHGGLLLRTRGEGDSTFSVFARATDAAEAALEAQAALSAEAWPSGIELRVRMALTTGETVERDGDYYGTTVNRAARLRGVADPGQIVVSRSTADVIVDHLEGTELVELGEQALRGLRRPERLFELRSIGDLSSSAAAPEEIALPAPLARTATGVFVARNDEIDRLSSLFQESAAGQRKLVLLAGEPGIGKTRLAAEFARRVHDSGATVLFGRCDEEGGEPNQPFAEAIRELVRTSPALARSGGTHLARLVPDMNTVLGAQAPPSLGDAESERRALFDAVARTIGALSSRAAVLMVIDDLHWATKPTLLMLRHLLRSEDASRIVVLATYRDTDVDRSHPLAEVLADLRRETDMTRIAVGGLDAAGIVAYVEATAGQSLDRHERRLADIVYEQTDGNPFFMVEVLRHFVETGAVYRADGRWHTDLDSIEASGLPEGVRDVITRRLGRLSETANKALALAAVVGQEFALDVLERAGDVEHADDLVDALEQAIRAGVIAETAPGRYAFVHALVRQTLYDELTSTRRARLHRRVGEAIEASSVPETNLGALAYHFAEAALDGQLAKAADYALRAGEQALSRLAHEQAITLLQRGLDVLELDADVDHARRAGLMHTLAIANWARGDRANAREAVIRSAIDARVCGDLTRLAGLAVLRAALTVIAEPDPLTEELCSEVLERVGQDEPALRARVLAAYARYRAFSLADATNADILTADAVDIARTAADSAVLASVLNARLLVIQALGRADEQLALANELTALASKGNDARSLAEGLIARAQAHLELGDVDSHVRDVEALDSLGQRTNWWLPLAFARTQQASLATQQGRFADSKRLAIEAIAHAGTDAELAIVTTTVMGVRCFHSGDLATWESGLSFLQSHAPGIGPYLPICAAWSKSATGDFDEARALLEPMFDGSEVRLPDSPIRTLGLALMTEVSARLSFIEPAEVLLTDLFPHGGGLMPAGRGTGSVGATDTFLGMLLAMLERWDEAEQRYQDALALTDRVGAVAFKTQAQLWYGNMLSKRDGPKNSQSQRVLTEALESADRLGMTLVSRDCRTLLAIT